ncbi:histidine phosphatase family protein [Desulfovibrio sp. JC022]|uniref:histidine phosphatase family protein n=1 Tax=Desulfovibrio sp. JC022 TaxID=2593642 RepID=UPI0013D06061|nr:histidine phosphatase family protein [Desulfovibrio sp. JC022]NDV24353.1 histidine phosphatase family protein [Desulfovibrio sp. JC022]
MIILIRHGEIEGAKGRAVGQIDLPLSANGFKQAAQLAESLESFQPRRIYCSPLTRTMQTASFIEKQCGLEAIPVPEIKEINLGEWDGLDFSELKKLYPQDYKQRGKDIAGFRAPGGENFTNVKERVSSFLGQLNGDSPIMAVTHAGVIRVVMHIVLDFPLDNIFRIKPDYCHVTVIESKGDGFFLKAYNLPARPGLVEELAEMMPKQG